MAVPNVPSADVHSKRQYLAAAEVVSLSGTSAKSTAQVAGRLYLVWADAVWHFRHGARANVEAATTDAKLSAYQVIEVWVSGTDSDGIAGILASGTASMYIQPVT